MKIVSTKFTLTSAALRHRYQERKEGRSFSPLTARLWRHFRKRDVYLMGIIGFTVILTDKIRNSKIDVQLKSFVRKQLEIT